MRDLLLMSYEEAEGYFRECDLVLLPLGSVEQHGPANPLGTDTLIADALAGEVSRRTGVLKLPVIPVGVSFHHMHFPGTLTVSERSLEEYLLDVIRSLARWGVKRVLVVNGHGGNLAALQVVSRRSMEELGVRVYVYQWWTSSSGILEGLFGPEERGHAAAAETSMIMHLHPESVLADRLLDQEVKEDKLSRLTHFSYTIEISGSGVLGRQRTASAERGRTLFEALAEDLSGIVEELKKVRS